MTTQLESKTRNRILIVLFVGVLKGALDIAIIAPALPALQTHFGGDRTLAWTLTICARFNLIGAAEVATIRANESALAAQA
jgi:hypothetical protein